MISKDTSVLFAKGPMTLFAVSLDLTIDAYWWGRMLTASTSCCLLADLLSALLDFVWSSFEEMVISDTSFTVRLMIVLLFTSDGIIQLCLDGFVRKYSLQFIMWTWCRGSTFHFIKLIILSTGRNQISVDAHRHCAGILFCTIVWPGVPVFREQSQVLVFCPWLELSPWMSFYSLFKTTHKYIAKSPLVIGAIV